MGKLIEINSSLRGERILPEISDSHIQNHLFENEDVLILKNVFLTSQLASIRDAVWKWSSSVPIAASQSVLDTNHHVVEIGISKLQKTFHVYHAYNFNQIMSLESGLKDQLLAVWSPMRELQNRIGGANADWSLDATGKKLHPQIIQYPQGGGLFSPHTHPLEPQRLGLILAISKRGVDFKTGGTGFEWEDRSGVDTSQYHDLGDLILFKYSVRHWISFVDIEEPLKLDSKMGRWTMVLPYY